MRLLVTGVTGCIGAATVRHLLEQGVDEVIGFSRSGDLSRVEASLHDRIVMTCGDIRNESELRSVFKRYRPTRVIHLAAYQTPDCVAYPFDGIDINVGGTINLCKAAVAIGGVERLVFASSAAVYGERELYPESGVFPSSPVRPATLYGHWKVAGEGIAQAFHAESGVATVSLRLAVTYGPGRDLGLTSAETTAMKAAVFGLPFEVPYAGRAHYHYVEDMGAGFGQAALAPFDGYGVFNLAGVSSTVESFLGHVEAALQSSGHDQPFRVHVADGASELAIPCDLDHGETLQRFPEMLLTPLEDGVRRSVARFIEMATARELRPEDVRL